MPLTKEFRRISRDTLDEKKIERLDKKNLVQIQKNLETNTSEAMDFIKNSNRMKVYKKIATMGDPIYVFIYQPNMGLDYSFVAIFKGLFWGNRGLSIVVQTGEVNGKPDYKMIRPYHIKQIKIIPEGKVIEWLNYERNTKSMLWKDRCRYHPLSVENPEWPGLVKL